MSFPSSRDEHCRQAATFVGSRGWIVGIVAAVVLVRAVAITQPLVGNFATKQAIYAMIARNWAEGRAPLWQPTLDCLADDGTRSWHLMEWPVTAFLSATLWNVCGGSLDVWGRVVNIACSAVAVVVAYSLARRRFGETPARATALVVGFAPLSIAYGRGWLLEPSLVLFSFVAVDAFDRWCRNRRTAWAAVAAATFALAVATKVYVVLLLVPLAWMWCGAPRSAAKFVVTPLLFAACLLPVVAWHGWVAGVSTVTGPGVDHHPWSRAEVHVWPHPLLTSPSYYLRVLRDLATVVLTPFGAMLALAGLFDRRTRPLLPWIAAMFLLPALLPLKFYAANYYYLILLPPAALAAGIGWLGVVERFAPSKRTTLIAVSLSLLIAARYAIGPGYRIPSEDRDVTTAAAAFRTLAPSTEPVATLHGSTLDLLYYCDRPGWAFHADDPKLPERLAEARTRGAVRLVVVDLARAERNAAFVTWRAAQRVEAAGADWQIVSLLPPSSTVTNSPPVSSVDVARAP